MAAGLRRLGSFLTSLLEVLTVLDATPAPRGSERHAAEALQQWCAARWPEVDWAVQPYGAGGANLIGRHRAALSSGPGVLLYSHLDTSLDGGPGDAEVTGRSDPPGRLRVQNDRSVDGFGLGVARAPAAAALLGFAEHAFGSGTLLLAGSGTHRRSSGLTGVEAYLTCHPRPAAAVIAKGGPPGVLWAEPGAAYLTVRLTGGQGVVLARDAARPAGGLIAHVGLVLAEIDSWRAIYISSRNSPGSPVGAEAGVGAIRAGKWTKPDLLPAALELGVYVVTVPGEDVPALARDLQHRLRTAIATGPLSSCGLDVTAEIVHAAAFTDPSSPIVTRAVAAWTEAFGRAPEPVTGWTGSTDGVVLRGRGVDTVRLGPQLSPSAPDARRDAADLEQLAVWPALYAAVLGAG